MRQSFEMCMRDSASAMSWILFIILFIITMVQWRGQKKWVSY